MHFSERLDAGLWFDPRSLLQLSDDATYRRGMALYIDQKVLSLEIEPMGDHWLLLGDVQGGHRIPYELSIEIAILPDGRIDYWDSDCTCPMETQCKHGVAVMLKAAYQGRQILGSQALLTPVAPRSPEQIEAEHQAALERAQQRARIEAEAQMMQWLGQMDKASSGVAPGSVLGNNRPEQFLYLLSVLGAQVHRPVLHLAAVVSYPKLSGGWAKPKLLKTPPYSGQAIFERATDADREVLQLIRAMPDHHSYRYSTQFSASVAIEGQVGLIALQQAASTGRLFVNDGHGGPGINVRWGETQSLQWEWQEVTTIPGLEPGWALRAKLRQGKATLCLNHPPLYLDIAQGICGQVQAEGVPAAQLDALLKAPALAPSALKKHQLELMQRLGSVPMPPVLETLTKLEGITPKACLHLSPTPAQDVPYRGLMLAQLRFDYAGHRGWWVGQGASVLIDSPQGRLLLQRDPEAELDAITRLFDFGLVSTDQGLFGIPGDKAQQSWLHWADNNFSVLREAGFELTLDDSLQGWIAHADTLQVDLQARGEDEATSPWFDLSLGMEINGERHNILPWLPELIAQAAHSPRSPDTGLPELAPFVYLRDAKGAGFIRLPTDALKPWMAALLELVGEREHSFAGDSLKLSRLDALRATASLGEGAVWQGAQALQDVVRQLSGQAELPEVAVPGSVQASLRPYQQLGLNWLQFLRASGLDGILADDMGLGKTLQTLAHIQVEKDAGRLTQPALVIAPVSLMGNWQREAARFCPQLRSLVLHGKDRHDVADTMHEHDLVIAPYSLLQRDRERWLQASWHLVVLDEAQNIKNASTHAAQVVGQLQTRHRLCLSGTPMENHLGELWSLFHFLMPGFLGSQARFKQLFRNPIEKHGDPERLTQLRARITPFMLRRTKALVASELPPKIETVMRVELSGKQADLYETIRLGMEKTVREALNSKGLAKSQITILDALLKLRQVCCDPQLVPLAAAKKVKTSAKLEQLMELLPEMLAEGRRILLFSQFTSMLTLIEAELTKRNLTWVKLTGQSQKRDALIERFTSGEVPLFLISLKAGGVGLNLPQADTVIHYDPWWNPAVETQATDRAHRIGQTQSVWVVKLVAQGTIEERILALQERKAALANSMYSGAAARKQPLFTESDLAELLKPLSSL